MPQVLDAYDFTSAFEHDNDYESFFDERKRNMALVWLHYTQYKKTNMSQIHVLASNAEWTETDTKELKNELKKEVLELVFQKSKFDYNSKLLKKINEKQFNNNDFQEFGKNKTQSLLLNSVKDNKKFEINSVELLYSLPNNSFTLISDEKNNIYLARIKDIQIQNANIDDKKFDEYSLKQNTNNKNSILKTYDLLLNSKYDVVMNEKAIERVKNFLK